VFPADLAWTRAIGDAAAAPTADRRHIYLPLEDRIVAFDRETGETAWETNVATRWPIETAGDSAFALTSTGLVELAAATGTIARRIDLPAPPNGAVARDGDVFIVPTSPAGLMAWHIRESRVVWTTTLPAPLQLGPVVSSGMVFVALADGRVTALRLGDGVEQWTTTLTGVPHSLACSRTVVVVSTSDRVVYVLAAAKGTFKSPPRHSVADTVGTAANDKRVFVASLDNTVRAFDAAHGAQLWKAVTDTRLTLPPQLTPEGLLVTGADSVLMMVSERTGKMTGTQMLPPLTIVATPPLLLADRDKEKDSVAVVVMTRAGELLGLKPKPLEKPKPDADAKAPAAEGKAPTAAPATPPAPAP
jgi:outer membrane protein assembly factor BamB